MTYIKFWRDGDRWYRTLTWEELDCLPEGYEWVRNDDEWVKGIRSGRSGDPEDSQFYRIPCAAPDPHGFGPGFRLLDIGEVIFETDQILCYATGWFNPSSKQLKKMYVGRRITSSIQDQVRRPITKWPEERDMPLVHNLTISKHITPDDPTEDYLREIFTLPRRDETTSRKTAPIPAAGPITERSRNVEVGSRQDAGRTRQPPKAALDPCVDELRTDEPPVPDNLIVCEECGHVTTDPMCAADSSTVCYPCWSEKDLACWTEDSRLFVCEACGFLANENIRVSFLYTNMVLCCGCWESKTRLERCLAGWEFDPYTSCRHEWTSPSHFYIPQESRLGGQKYVTRPFPRKLR